MVKKVLLIGATGLTGSHLLNLLLEDDSIDVVVAPSRKAIENDSSKLENVIFSDIDELDFKDKQIDCVLCCFGTTAKNAGSSQKFEEIENHFMQTLMIKARQAKIDNMIMMSSIGASEKLPVTYLRVKGEIEQFAKSMSFKSLYVLRPSALVGARDESREVECLVGKFADKVGFLANPLSSFWPVQAQSVAKAMKKFSQYPKPGYHLIDNSMIHAIG